MTTYIGGYSIGEMILWAVIFVVVWKVISWLWEKIFHSHNNKKKWLIIILIVIGAYLLYNTYTDGYSMEYMENQLKELQTKTYTSAEAIESVKTTKETCEDKASKLVPLKLTLKKYNQEGDWYLNKEQEWNDGSKMENAFISSFHKGEHLKENINYLYPGGKNDFSRTHPGYVKTIISKEGVVLGETTFRVDYILDPISEEYPLIDTEVVTFKILDCKWIEEP